jgi:hypothetical protein
MARRTNPWIGLSLNAWALGMEASTVMGLRTLKIAAGGDAGAAEADLMVREKVKAASELQVMALTGALGFTAPAAASKTLTHYRRKVRANRRRLTRA